jgi:glycosyltransferase involved in cell wall biosynthesis
VHILHTESSNGWGGQEIRILKEAEGLRKQGFQITFAVTLGGKLALYARDKGFEVIEIDFKRSRAFQAVWQLCRLIKNQKIDLINTHSSLDAWLGGVAARLAGKPIVRTRHLSTPIRGGLNAKLLYNRLADYVVTTSSGIIPAIQEKAHLPFHRIQCIPTGVEPFHLHPNAAIEFRRAHQIGDDDILIGSVCVVRSWKGIQDLIAAAKLLQHDSRFKWIVVGGGYIDHFKPQVTPDLPFTFIGHLEDPGPAIAALDIFALLSTANEGISQASLQAAFLKKPLVTTTVGGLPEVCHDSVTGILVPPSSPEEVAKAVLKLAGDATLRKKMGSAAYDLVTQKYTLRHTLEGMAHVFNAFS